MKRLINIISLAVILFGFSACESTFIDDSYVSPEAVLSIDKTEYDVFESVLFSNKGSGQKFVVYPGDEGHRYNTPFNTGYATASNGKFSYSYQEPGEYTAVWVASSIKQSGEIVYDVDSVKITVAAKNGGLNRLNIYRIYRMSEYSGSIFYTSMGKFVSTDTIVCPILFDAWRPSATINSIVGKQMMSFELESSLAKMYWVNNGVENEIKSEESASRVVDFMKDGKLSVQKFVVKTASGFASDYFVAPVMIPKMTKLEINGVEAAITRDLAYYDRFEAKISLPAGSDLKAVKPVFEIMNNDSNLTDGTNYEVTVNGIKQTSGVTSIDASGKSIEYKISAGLLGESNSNLYQEATIVVTVQ